MNSVPSSSGVTDYLEYFGLEQDPFEGEVPLFDGGERREQFEQLLHLCQFSTRLLAVVGQSGVGKSTVKRELVARLDTLDIVAELDVPLLNNPEQLLTALAEAFELPLPTGDGSSSTENTIRLIDALRDYGATPEDGDPLKIVVVEDAHNLDEASLSSLVQLTRTGHEEIRSLHLVMFGEPSLGPRLQALETDNRMVQTFPLQPLSPEELKRYLRFRLDAAGFDGVFPFRAQDIQFLWEQSGGVPGAVHGPARELLIELAVPPPKPKSLGLPLPHMIVVISLLAGLLLVVFYQVADEPAPVAPVPARESTPEATTAAVPPGNAQPANSPGQEANTGDPERQPAPDNNAGGVDPAQVSATGEAIADTESGNDEPSTTPVPDQPSSPPPQSPTPAQPEPEPQQPPVNSANTQANSADNSADTQADEPATSPALENETLANAGASESELEEALLSEARRAELTDHEARLLAFSPDKYVLQVLASGTREGVEAFIQRQSNQGQLHYYTAKRNGQTLHIVLAGVYPSREAARSAISGLPEEQRRAQPWPRRLEAAQAEIRSFRGL